MTNSLKSPQQMTNNPKIITKDKAKEILWKKGNLAFKLDQTQLELYNFVRNHEKHILVIGASRRLGKSYFLLTLAYEECLRAPNRIVKYVAQTLKEVKKITDNLRKEFEKDMPRELRPHFHTHHHTLIFPNGSEIHFGGTENGRGENIRGTDAHLAIVDEAGFCDDLEYIVQSVLFPLTSLTGGKIILASTPSKSIDHPFIKMWREAELDGRFIKKTIFDNPRLTKERIDELAEAVGGYDSVTFRREYMAEIITSEEDSVIPEFTKEIEQEIVREYPRPLYYNAYVAMDIGGADLTAILFAYYDFRESVIVIEDELMFKKGSLSDDIALGIKEKEKTLWQSPTNIYRFSDNNNIILLNDLGIKHGLFFVPTLKDNKEAALNDVRLKIKAKRIIINPRCKNLIAHLKGAVWAKNKKTFAKTKEMGHYDFVDALTYLVRNINYNNNPYPDSFTLEMAVNNNQPPPPPPKHNSLENYLIQKIRSKRRFF